MNVLETHPGVLVYIAAELNSATNSNTVQDALTIFSAVSDSNRVIQGSTTRVFWFQLWGRGFSETSTNRTQRETQSPLRYPMHPLRFIINQSVFLELLSGHGVTLCVLLILVSIIAKCILRTANWLLIFTLCSPVTRRMIRQVLCEGYRILHAASVHRISFG